MAKDRRKLQHIHSSIPDKQPTAASLEVGEIAVNNSKDQEFLSIKNSNDKVVRFSSDGQIIEWIERKEVMPYEGYIRGSEGPEGSTGPNSVTNDDLLQNKSNIIIKLNQVAASATTKHDIVNGSKDIYNKEVNPSDDGGISDGAGFAIDMSRYAMIDANPSFSSLTVTVQTDLSGNTTISDGAGVNEYGTDTGHTFTIETTDVVANDTNWTENITNQNSTITTLNESATTRTTVVGTENLRVSGTTTEVKVGDVTENNQANKTENTTGNVVTNTTGTTTETKIGNVVENHSGTTTENLNGNFSGNTTGTTTEIKIGNVAEYHSGTTTENKKGDVVENNLSDKTENTTGNNSIYSTGNTCITSQADSNLYGKESTNIGVACDGTKGSATTVYGSSTIDVSGGTITETSTSNTNVNVGGNLSENITGNVSTNITGTTTEVKSGNVSETNKADVVTNTSGTTTINNNGLTTINVLSGTVINSCNGLTANTNNLFIQQCDGEEGTAEFDFCGGYSVNTDKMEIKQCGANGTIEIVEKATIISGETLSISESGNTTVNSDGVVDITAKEEVLVESSENDVVITANNDLCSTASNGASFYGTEKTNIGLNCDDSSSSTTTNVYGETINVDASTANTVIGTADTKISSATTVINVLNESATTATISGDSLTIKEATSTVISGGTLSTITTGDTSINTSGATNIVSNDDVCIKSNESADFYGKTSTNIGIACDGSESSATTIVGSTILNISGDTITETGDIVNISGTNNVNVNSGTICVSGNTEAVFYAPKTQIGVSCEGSIATSTTVEGTAIIVSGNTTNITGATTLNLSGATTNISAVTLNESGSTLNQQFSTINISGKTINQSGDTYNITANTINNGDLTVTGDLYLTPNCTDEITSTTVNDALCEILDRNAVTMTTETPAATSEILKTYKLWQNGNQIGEDINIPKDHLLKSAEIVYGKLNGSTFTPCTAVASDCHWYIKLVWNVFDPSTGHADDKTTYMPADDFIKDIDDSNPTDVGTAANHNVVVDVWYDGEKNLVSASTTPTMNVTNLYASNTITGATVSGATGKFTTLSAGTTTISGATTINNTLKVTGNTTLAATTASTISATSVSSPTISGTNITASSAIKANNVSANTISAATKVTTKDLDATGNVNITGTTNISGATKIDDKLTVTDVLDAQKGLSHKLSISFGAVGSIAGNPYNGSGDTTVVIPNHSSAYTHYNLNIVHNGLNKTYDPASNAVTSMTLPHSALTLSYGSSAGKSGSVTYNTSATGSVTIPTSTDDITNKLKTLTITVGGTPGVTGSPYNGSSTASVVIPKNMSDIGSKGSLTIKHNGLSSSYTPGDTSTFTLPHSALTLSYGDASNLTATTTYNTSASGSVTIPNSLKNISKGYVEDSNPTAATGTINIKKNVSVTGSVSASNGFFQTSDERKKDNIEQLSPLDMENAANIFAKSFTLKGDETGRKMYGVIAQEVEKAGLPELVHTDEDGYKSVDYTSLLILKVAHLETYCNILNGMVNELLNRLENKQ